MRAAPVVLAGAMLLAGCGKGEQTVPATEPVDVAREASAIAPTAAMGEQQFKRCMACHSIDAGGRNGIGPNLHGVVGRRVGAHPGFSYSTAMKARGGLWDEAALDTYLEAPTKALPGTRMAFAGIIEPADRAALILYLKQQAD